jgi:hypothetical protein
MQLLGRPFDSMFMRMAEAAVPMAIPNWKARESLAYYWKGNIVDPSN